MLYVLRLEGSVRLTDWVAWFVPRLGEGVQMSISMAMWSPEQGNA